MTNSDEQGKIAAAWEAFQRKMTELRRRKWAVHKRIDEQVRGQRLASARKDLDEGGEKS